MAQRSHVPAFGNWENEGNVPYTVFFEKARKGRNGAPIRNPNDPEEYADVVSEQAPPTKLNDQFGEPTRQGTVKPTHERRQSREDGGFKQYANSPGHRENPSRRAAHGEAYGRQTPEHSIERSPLHRHAKVSGRDSPSWEGKSFESGHGKTKMKPSTREDTHEGTAVPKFGSWDVNNPASADGFTHIFGKVREEKIGPGSSPVVHSSPYNNVNNHLPDDSAKGCCFPWMRK